MQLCFWNSQSSYIIIRMAPLTTYQHSLTFSCSRNGLQMLFHVISPSMYSNHSKIKKWHTKKLMNRHIAIRIFISVLIWEHIVYLILLLITHNIIYFNFLFLDSFLSQKLIWHSPYCRHMICHLCFRRYIRFTNYNFCTHK